MPQSDPTPPSRLPRWAPSAGLVAGLFLLYQLNGPFERVGDAVPNLYLPVQVLARGSLTFSPEEQPFMFVWEDVARAPGRQQGMRSWDDPILGETARDLYRSGRLKLIGPRYYLAPAAQPGRYVGIYGPGAGISALPWFALTALVRPNWRDNTEILGGEAKLFASLCVAVSALFLFWSLRRFVAPRPALLLALIYGAGTCVWAEPSQALWQQTPALLYIAIGLYLFLRIGDGPRWAAGCGAALGAAAACRPSLVLLLAAVGVCVLLKHRKAAIPMAAGAALPLLLLAAFNAHYLGSPFRFGQVAAAEKLARDSAWRGSPLGGLPGLLFSPSRGLFVYSPFLLFAVWGGIRCWKSSDHAALRPLTVAIPMGLVLAAVWFQWWGGWCYGYRMIAEFSPLLVLLLAPVGDRLFTRGPLASVFGFLAFLSVVIQGLGAFGFDSGSWNNRSAYRIRVNGVEERTTMEDSVERARAGTATYLGTVEMDLSKPEFQYRLWSWTDSQLAWLLRPHAVAEGLDYRRKVAADAAFERSRRPDEP